MIIACNCTFCKNLIDIKVEGELKVVLMCKAFPDGVPRECRKYFDYNTERECANGFHFIPEDKLKKRIEEREQRKLEQSNLKKETIFDKVKKLIKR